MQPGGPGRYVPPATREHGRPEQAFVNPLPVPLLTPVPVVPPPIVGPVAGGLAEAVGTAVLLPVALILAFILGSTTPAQAPGLPVDPNLLRLRQLTAKHAAGTLTADEEAELIDLLAKVKGIRVQKLSDLVVEGHYKKQPQALPGFHFEGIMYKKRSKADTDALRRKFDSSVRAKFMKKISSDPSYARQLRDAGFDDKALKIMRDGNVPKEWQVHHKLPLDDGGDNTFSNLLLIENKPYHGVVTGYQKTHTGKLQPGESVQIKWPTYNQGIVYPPKKP